MDKLEVQVVSLAADPYAAVSRCSVIFRRRKQVFAAIRTGATQLGVARMSWVSGALRLRETVH